MESLGICPVGHTKSILSPLTEFKGNTGLLLFCVTAGMEANSTAVSLYEKQTLITLKASRGLTYDLEHVRPFVSGWITFHFSLPKG